MLNASDPSAFYQVVHIAANSTGRSKRWGGGDRIEPLLPLPLLVSGTQTFSAGRESLGTELRKPSHFGM